MTRGNQREVDRQRAQKKQEEKLRAAGRVSFFDIVAITLTIDNIYLIYSLPCVPYRSRVVIH